MIDLLNYRFTRDKKDDESMEDVYDGVLYKNLSKPGGFSYQTQATYPFLGTQMALPLLNPPVGQFGLFTLLSMNYRHC